MISSEVCQLSDLIEPEPQCRTRSLYWEYYQRNKVSHGPEDGTIDRILREGPLNETGT